MHDFSNPWYDLARAFFISTESLYWMKHSSFLDQLLSMCDQFSSSELLLSTHLPTSEGWTAELTVGLWLVVPTTGFEPTLADLA